MKPAASSLSDQHDSRERADFATTEFPAIDDYAIIGDCCTAALVARSGAIEWLFLPDISSASMFGSILDRRNGGSFTLCPDMPFKSERRYLPEIAILETTYRTSSGRARVLDFMSIGDGDHRWRARLRPQRELIRIVEGLEGRVAFVTRIDPRPDYGRRPATASYRGGFGWVFPGPGSLMTIRTDFNAKLAGGEARLVGRASVGAGESRTVSLAFAGQDIAVQLSSRA